MRAAFLPPPRLAPLRRARALHTPRCSATEIARRVRSGETTAESEVSASLARIAASDGEYRAFLSVSADIALSRAREVDALVRTGRDLPLAGVPVAVKDNLCVRGGLTTAGSRILDGFVSAYDATAVQKIQDAGAIVVGKTNMDEFGMGGSTENSAYYATRNPVDTARVPGGSSGGSAAAVAAGMVPVSLGSDTGGSIRLPAAYCGVVGLKPSYGRVSRHGLLAYASSLDTIGPLTRDVRDAALVLRVISGEDSMDATSAVASVPDYPARMRDNLRGMVLGVVADALDAADADVARRVREAVSVLEGLGARVVEVRLRGLDAALAAYYVLATSEASANLARYDGVRYGVRANAENAKEVYTRSRATALGAEVQRRILLGTYALSAGYADKYYRKALRVREFVREQYAEIFAQGVHALLSPVTPDTAFRLGEVVEQTTMYANDVMNVPASLAGLPAVSVPCGVVKGLPVGLQVVAPYLAEQVVLDVAAAYEGAVQAGRTGKVQAEVGA